MTQSPTRPARKPAVLPKSDGNAGVRAYIASMEPWQAAIARRADALVVKHAPGVRKAVKWHCPFYGIDGQGWFLAFSAFQRHVKFTFFKGTSLEPVPPSGQQRDARSLDVRESDRFDEKRFASWIRQAAAIPGWDGGARPGKEKQMKTSEPKPSKLISERIAELGDWRGKTLARMRKLIRAADPDVVEEWKWENPVWSHDGILCTGEAYKKVVKLTFPRGASLKDPAGLFNSSLEGNVRRAIDIAEGETVDEAAFKALIRQAVALNGTGKAKSAGKKKARA